MDGPTDRLTAAGIAIPTVMPLAWLNKHKGLTVVLWLKWQLTLNNQLLP